MDMYFIAIPTPQQISEKIRLFQQEFDERFDARRQLRIPVHLTLVPPFHASEDQIIELKEVIEDFVSGRETFNIPLSGFGHFRKDVVFVNVPENQSLDKFQSEFVEMIRESESIKLPKMHHKFTAHITLANRDLSEENFIKAWPEFEHREFDEQFQSEEIVLYKHDGKLWQVDGLFNLSYT